MEALEKYLQMDQQCNGCSFLAFKFHYKCEEEIQIFYFVVATERTDCLHHRRFEMGQDSVVTLIKALTFFLEICKVDSLWFLARLKMARQA